MDKENETILLSICIPTYNRSQILDKTIASIVYSKGFSSEVELVISDNCSTDDTKLVVEKYIEHFPNICYYRNDENIADANFIKVLSLGKGDYLKLLNDTALFKENTLRYLIDTIHLYRNTKEFLFFSNGKLKNPSKIICSSFDSFINKASYWSTWILSFGTWKKDFENIKHKERYCNLQLCQTDLMFRLVSSKEKSIIINEILFEIHPVERKGGYNLFSVFVNNYLFLFDEYIKSNQISHFTLIKEKHKLYHYHLFPWMKTLLGANNQQYHFEKKSVYQILFKEFKFYPIFYVSLIYIFLYKLLKSFKY